MKAKADDEVLLCAYLLDHTHSVMFGTITASTYFCVDPRLMFGLRLIHICIITVNSLPYFYCTFAHFSTFWLTFNTHLPTCSTCLLTFRTYLPYCQYTFCLTVNTHLVTFSTVGLTLNTYLLISNTHFVLLSIHICLMFLHFGLLLVHIWPLFQHVALLFVHICLTFNIHFRHF